LARNSDVSTAVLTDPFRKCSRQIYKKQIKQQEVAFIFSYAFHVTVHNEDGIKGREKNQTQKKEEIRKEEIRNEEIRKEKDFPPFHARRAFELCNVIK